MKNQIREGKHQSNPRVQSNRKMLWKVAEKFKSFCKYFHVFLTNKIWEFYIVIIKRQINLQTHTESLHTIHVWSFHHLQIFIADRLRAWELIVWVFAWSTNTPTFATEEYFIHLFTSRFYRGRNLRIQELIGSAVHSVQ